MRPTFPEESFDPSNWWMGEKFEGERGCWNPNCKMLYQFVVRLLLKLALIAIHIFQRKQRACASK
jgi:hypothetical protein